MLLLSLLPGTALATEDAADPGEAVAAETPSEEVCIDEENFPDDNFRSYVIENIDADGNGTLSDEECKAVKQINLTKDGEPILCADLTGIGYFTNLTELYLNNCGTETLDLTKNTALQKLGCSNCSLKELDLSGCPDLREVGCVGNQLTKIDVSLNPELTFLSCGSNQAGDLDLTQNTKLTTLACSNMGLTNLNVSMLTELEVLYCSRNELKYLDVSGNLKLRELYAYSNLLTKLDLSKNDALTKTALTKQKTEGTLTHDLTKDTYSLDLTKIAGNGNAGRVTILSTEPEGVSYEYKNGIFTSPKEVTAVKYGFDTGAEGQDPMEVTVSLTVDEVNPPPHSQTCPSQNYTDVDPDEGTWYHAGVDYCVTNGYMTGMSSTSFLPEGNVTRAQVVQILYAREGKPESEHASYKFSDITAADWYDAAVGWAASRDIVAGYTDGTFRPNDAISREQLAAILYKYSLYRGYDVTATGILINYIDASSISVYAVVPMRWAVGHKLLSGTTIGLEPKGPATRAQMAVILKAFDENIGPADPT